MINETRNVYLDGQGLPYVGDTVANTMKSGGISTEYGRLTDGLASLEKEVAILHDTLKSVLNPPLACGTGGDKNPQPIRSTFAETIASDADRLWTIRLQIEELRNRIDL
jgi:hypothetical protein